MYNTIQNNLKDVMKVAAHLRENNQELNVFVHYSLFRFLIPKEAQSSLKFFFSQDGLLSSTSEHSNFSRISLWNFYYRTVYFRHNKGISRKNLLTENELYILYGSFWILNLYDKIIDFNAKLEYLRPLSPSLLMLLGASVYRAIGEALPEEHIEEGDPDDLEERQANVQKYRLLYANIIKVLEERLDEPQNVAVPDIEEIAQVKIVLAYLYFHLWLQEGNVRIVMQENYLPEAIAFHPGTANYKAVDYARQAFNFFQQQKLANSVNYLYSFNIYLYFVIDSAPDDEFRKLGALRGKFIALKGEALNWHFRYDDTVARNFHRLSMLVISPDSKRKQIDSAIAALENNLRKYEFLEGRDIKEVRAYLEVLKNLQGQLEIAS